MFQCREHQFWCNHPIKFCSCGTLEFNDWVEQCNKKYNSFDQFQRQAAKIKELEELTESYNKNVNDIANQRDKYWTLLCKTVEKLGKISPEAAPYADQWAAKRMEELEFAKKENTVLKTTMTNTLTQMIILLSAPYDIYSSCLTIERQKIDKIIKILSDTLEK